MNALILSKDGVVLNVIDVADEAHLDLIHVGNLDKVMQSDIANEEKEIKIGDDVSPLLLAAKESATAQTKETVVKRIARALGIIL